MTTGDPFLDVKFIQRFQSRRQQKDSVNTCVDEPAILAKVRNFSPNGVLELGIGTGALTEKLLEFCSSVVAVDQSPVMIETARQRINSSNVEFVCSAFEDFQPTQKHEMIVSAMAMHLVKDLGELSNAMFDWLRPGGSLIFSQRHPIRTANPGGDSASKTQPSWTVTDYFNREPRLYDWLGHSITNYHRTVSDIVSSVIGAGFHLVALEEPKPVGSIRTGRTLENESSPSVLLITCKKPTR